MQTYVVNGADQKPRMLNHIQETGVRISDLKQGAEIREVEINGVKKHLSSLADDIYYSIPSPSKITLDGITDSKDHRIL